MAKKANEYNSLVAKDVLCGHLVLNIAVGIIRSLIKKATCSKTRRHFGGAALGVMGFCSSWAVDVEGGGAEWLEVVEVDLHLNNLAKEFVNMRIVHISDLHCSRTVSSKYLTNCIERVNQLDADIVLLTGDYITHDIFGRFGKRIVELVSGISSRHGVYACMGNHDYGVDGFFGSGRHDRLYEMIEGMGVAVLMFCVMNLRC